ncbi:MAG: sulfite exporter TauE/SafE family protein, partial [Flavobacteriales bacterium]|nr:sulfite exporter TauE/SafE family protein [Flavobacteriales bacterium]
MTAAILSLFVLGLSGSLHCAGMCGPIVLALGGSGGKIRSMLT